MDQWTLLMKRMSSKEHPNESFINYIATGLLYMDDDKLKSKTKLNIHQALAESTSEWILMENVYKNKQNDASNHPILHRPIKRSPSMIEIDALTSVSV